MAKATKFSPSEAWEFVRWLREFMIEVRETGSVASAYGALHHLARDMESLLPPEDIEAAKRWIDKTPGIETADSN